jgi:hypothetical protein
MGVDDFELACRPMRLRPGVRRAPGVSVNPDALVADTDCRGRTLAAAVRDEGTKGGRDDRLGARSG